MNELWLKNVKLELGLDHDENNYTYPKTETVHLKIKNGKIIKKVDKETVIKDDVKAIDMHNFLAVPTFKEMHNHLDKTYLGLDWKSCTPAKNLKDRLKLESLELKELSETGVMRAEAMIKLLTSHGATHIRTHVNVDKYIGTKNLETVLEALEKYKNKVSYEIVAFPQHGLLDDGVIKLMNEVMRNGATIVGGVDPGGIDNSVEKSLYEIMNLATKFNATTDLHIHDSGHLGFYTIDRWLDMIEDAQWKRQSAISHAFSLGDVPYEKQAYIGKRLVENDVCIMSTVPLISSMPPIDLFDNMGVEINFGCDGFYDSWHSYGTGNLLEKLTLFCEITGKKDELSISQTLKYITGGITPLNNKGEQIWPLVGDDANFLFVDAESSAHMIARKIEFHKVMRNGYFI